MPFRCLKWAVFKAPFDRSLHSNREENTEMTRNPLICKTPDSRNLGPSHATALTRIVSICSGVEGHAILWTGYSLERSSSYLACEPRTNWSNLTYNPLTRKRPEFHHIEPHHGAAHTHALAHLFHRPYLASRASRGQNDRSDWKYIDPRIR